MDMLPGARIIPVKIKTSDAHDRYSLFTRQGFDIGECCQDLIDKRPFGSRPFYIFAHARTDDDGLRKRLIWQPRLTKPKMQTNSMLFKAYPPGDNIKVIWLLPDRHLWDQFVKGNITESSTVAQSIYDFKHRRHILEAPEPDDPTEEQIDAIYREISRDAKGRAKPSGLLSEQDSAISAQEGKQVSIQESQKEVVQIDTWKETS